MLQWEGPGLCMPVGLGSVGACVTEPVWAGGGGGDSALPPGSAGNEAELVAEPCGGRGKAGHAPGGLLGVLIRRAEAGCVTWAGDAKAGRSPSWEENR